MYYWCFEKYSNFSLYSAAKPVPPSHIQLIQAQEHSIKLCWGSVANAEGYLLQIKQYDLPSEDDNFDEK